MNHEEAEVPWKRQQSAFSWTRITNRFGRSSQFGRRDPTRDRASVIPRRPKSSLSLVQRTDWMDESNSEVYVCELPALGLKG